MKKENGLHVHTQMPSIVAEHSVRFQMVLSYEAENWLF